MIIAYAALLLVLDDESFAIFAYLVVGAVGEGLGGGGLGLEVAALAIVVI